MYFNTPTVIASGVTASASFSTSFVWQNFDCGAVQVVWTGLNSSTSTFKLQASIDGTNYSDLQTSTITMVSGSSSQLYNITDAGYGHIKCVYTAGSATVGTLDIAVLPKSRR